MSYICITFLHCQGLFHHLFGLWHSSTLLRLADFGCYSLHCVCFAAGAQNPVLVRSPSTVSGASAKDAFTSYQRLVAWCICCLIQGMLYIRFLNSSDFRVFRDWRPFCGGIDLLGHFGGSGLTLAVGVLER